MTEYNVKVIDKSFDGILGVEFRHKYTDFVFIVCACYLPPENSVWGKNSTAFFSHLILLMYTCNYADGMHLCGDYNARVGRGSDIINDVDDLPDRKIIDNVKNSHGDVLLEFLNKK